MVAHGSERSGKEKTVAGKPDTHSGMIHCTGKPIRKSIYGATQQEVRKQLNAITVTIDNGEYKEPSKLTVKDLKLDQRVYAKPETTHHEII